MAIRRNGSLLWVFEVQAELIILGASAGRSEASTCSLGEL